MVKADELSRPDSCLNRAKSFEWVFVLLARDAAAPAAIRAWVEKRIALGKNNPEDEQIQEALRCADLMDQQRESGVIA